MTDIQNNELGETVCTQLLAEMQKLGFTSEQLTRKPIYEQAIFEKSRDPFSGEDTLCASWRDSHGHRIGEIKFHGDGSFYAEYDVVLPHPTDPRWFVEGVVAWGKGDTIKSEAKLLSALSE